MTEKIITLAEHERRILNLERLIKSLVHNPEDCSKIDKCWRMKVILDKELPDTAETMRKQCANCSEFEGRK